MTSRRNKASYTHLISDTTWWVYTKQFQFLKKYATDRSEVYKNILHQEFHCLVYIDKVIFFMQTNI